MPTVKRGNAKVMEQLNFRLKQLEGIVSKVGWFQSAKYEDGTPAAYVAAIQELGCEQKSIPPRPFMRPTAIEQAPSWGRTAAQGARAVVNGKADVQTVMQAIGLQAEGDVAATIANVQSPPLSPVTIELRAMKQRNPDLRVTAATVGEAARRVREPGYVAPSNVSTKPLNDTGFMISTLTHVVEAG